MCVNSTSFICDVSHTTITQRRNNGNININTPNDTIHHNNIYCTNNNPRNTIMVTIQINKNQTKRGTDRGRNKKSN